MPAFPSVDWFEAVRGLVNQDESFRRLGTVDARVGVKVGDEAYELTFEAFDQGLGEGDEFELIDQRRGQGGDISRGVEERRDGDSVRWVADRRDIDRESRSRRFERRVISDHEPTTRGDGIWTAGIGTPTRPT